MSGVTSLQRTQKAQTRFKRRPFDSLEYNPWRSSERAGGWGYPLWTMLLGRHHFRICCMNLYKLGRMPNSRVARTTSALLTPLITLHTTTIHYSHCSPSHYFLCVSPIDSRMASAAPQPLYLTRHLYSCTPSEAPR